MAKSCISKMCGIIFGVLVCVKIHGQSLSYSSPRAISINDVVFEVKGNILGVFYINPVVDLYAYEGDSIRVKGQVIYQFKPRSDVHIYVCHKKKPKLREWIGRQTFYTLDRYLVKTATDGSFELVIHRHNEKLLLRDFGLNQDCFLLFEE